MVPLQRALSCISKDVLRPSGYEPAATAHILTTTNKPCRLDGTDLYFDIAQWFYIIEDATNGPWRVTTAGYKYTLETEDGDEILGYHWHPDSSSQFKEPHLHLGQGAKIGRAELESTKAHLPTGRVSLEDFIKLLIEVFEIRPKRDWMTVLAETGGKFWRYASWGRRSRT
jgi:hypothetical protein